MALDGTRDYKEPELQPLLSRTEAGAPPDIESAAEETSLDRPEDISQLLDKDTWRLFNSIKQSAVAHLDECLHHREAVRQQAGVSGPLSLVLDSQSDDETPQSFRDFKAARDGLLSDLDFLIELLEYQYAKSARELVIFYVLIVILLIPVLFHIFTDSTAAKWIAAFANGAFGMTLFYTIYRTAWFRSVRVCLPTVKRVCEHVQQDTLNDTGRADLESMRFRFFPWARFFREKS